MVGVSTVPSPAPAPHASKVSIPPIVLGSLTSPRCRSLPVPETLKGDATQRGAGRSGPLGLPHDRWERLQPGPDHLQGECNVKKVGFISAFLVLQRSKLAFGLSSALLWSGSRLCFTGFILEGA